MSIAGSKVINGATASAVSDTAFGPLASSTDTLWVRVTHDGTTLKVYEQTGSSQPSSWGSSAFSSTSFRSTGGMIGFMGLGGNVIVDTLTVNADRDNDGSHTFETAEHKEFFTLDGSGLFVHTPTYDLAGNLTYDGVNKLAYDAWNRLATISKAYRDGSGTLQTGSTTSTMSYDGKGRRIQKAVANSADLDCTYKYYLDGDSVIETRNGSDTAIKQEVWGTRYVDELVQVKLVDTTSTDYWVCQDSNYNVLGIVNSSAVLKERYEYTPYGQRTTFFAPGTNDSGDFAPTLMSRRYVDGSSVTQPYALCEFGHQGLLHDEESSLVYNRARMLVPGMGMFGQRDPMRYTDGMRLFAYELDAPIMRLDNSGMCDCPAAWPAPPTPWPTKAQIFMNPDAPLPGFIWRTSSGWVPCTPGAPSNCCLESCERWIDWRAMVQPLPAPPGLIVGPAGEHWANHDHGQNGCRL